jgi:arabinofuranan 3-O-arabinosyltransferase
MLLVGFPLYTGVVVPDSRPGLPPVHVRMPGYWPEMARFVDALPIQGALLAMPPDDFYQMPYKWGYYGTDTFVVDMFRRPVLLPNAQGYSPASSQLAGAVDLTAQSIVRHDWRQTENLVRALNAPLVLVRGDIDSSFPNRSILDPNDLAAALSAVPNFVLIRQAGPLRLFSLVGATKDTEIGAPFVTTNSATPDLRLLPLVPLNAGLVTHESLQGLANLAEAPQLELWSAGPGELIWRPKSISGSKYEVAELASGTTVSLSGSRDRTVDFSSAKILYQPDSPNNAVTVSLPTRSAISNGDFSGGLWGPVGDCNEVNPAGANINATLIPNAAPGGFSAMQLSASNDSACEFQSLAWRGGPLVLSLLSHSVRGAAPRVCLWEFGPNHCAPLAAIPDRSGWVTYRASVTPDAGTTAISLYLYADAAAIGVRTVSDYANVRVATIRNVVGAASASNTRREVDRCAQ